MYSFLMVAGYVNNGHKYTENYNDDRATAIPVSRYSASVLALITVAIVLNQRLKIIYVLQ